MELLTKGHAGQAGNPEDLAGAACNAAPAAKPRRSSLGRERPQALGRKGPNAGAKVVVPAHRAEYKAP